MGIETRVNGQPPAQIPLEDINLGVLRFWGLDDSIRDGAFATLRREAPIKFFHEIEFEGFDAGPGHWALTKFDDVHFASRHPEIFSSYPNITIADQQPEVAEYFGSMISLDDPRHARLRGIVRSAFTPKVVARTEESVRARAQRLVQDLIANHPDGNGELVTELSGPLPLQVICDMMGIPAEDEQRMFELSNVILGFGDPEYVTTVGDLVSSGMDLFQYGLGLAEQRLREPRDDIATALVHAEVDGERLTAAELGSFFVLLVVAGNETTRTAISHGILALSQYPEERAKWLADPIGVGPTAVEEIVRWASPVIHFRRTATADTELGGQRIAEGDRVVMLYLSANRDGTVFSEPDRFNVTRSANDHVAFGAGGPHFCLGANLARREIRVMFDELLTRLPDLTVTGEPDRLRSAFINGIKRMPAAFTPTL
jgi:cytochrome P450